MRLFFYARECLWLIFWLVRLFRQEAGFEHLKFIVSREIHDEIPGHGLMFAQSSVHHDAFDTIDCRGHAPWRIAQMATWTNPSRPKRAHDASKALRPIARAKRATRASHALNKNFTTGGDTGHCGFWQECSATSLWLLHGRELYLI